MKSKVVGLILLFTAVCNAQNFFPNKLGTEYIRQYKYSYYSYEFGFGSTSHSTLDFDSTTVADSIIFEGKVYYEYFDNYYYFSSVDQKLFILLNNQSKLAVDFTAAQGTKDTLYFDNNAHYYTNSGVYIDTLFGAERQCFRISFDSLEVGPNSGYPELKWYHEYVFVDSIGLYKRVYKYHEDENPDKLLRKEYEWKNVFVDVENRIYAELYPPNFTDAMLVSQSKILLKWNHSYIRDGFIIERKLASDDDFSAVDTTGGNTLIYIDDGIVPGNEYQYRLRTIKAGIISYPTSVKTVNSLLQPGIILADTSSEGKIILSWEYPPAVYDGFILERRQWLNGIYGGFSWSDFEVLDTLEYGTAEYTDSNVSIAPYFIYRLRVYNNTLLSAYSPYTIATPLYPDPEIPANLRISDSSSTELNLEWDRKDEFQSYYRVQRKELSSQSEFTFLHNGFVKNTIYTDRTIEEGKDYAYRVKAYFADRQSDFSDTVYTTLTLLKDEIYPSDFLLEQNYPNPFNPSTKISYNLKNSGRVSLNIYDMKGELITKLVDGYQSSGYHTKTFSSETYNLSSGVYLYRLTVTDQKGQEIYSKVNKCILVK